ncbi:MAG: hypothetical protein ABEJ31_14365 [Haloarculaceae archaeon]
MSDSDPQLDRLRSELQAASEDAGADERETLTSLREAVGRLDAWDDDPKQDNLESIRAELARIEDDADGDARESIHRAREHVRDIIEERLAEGETVDEDG